MRRNCNLELELFPSRMFPGHRQNMVEESKRSPQNQQQQLTIFYNGRVCVCDITELQARAILMRANQETDERIKTPTGSEPDSPTSSSSTSPSRLCSPNAGLSMKKSLQRFLQKRKNRIQATSPYH
ncbi:hypothetical protein E1A91_A09G084600v1 [Gossypium mustelinum]|uniref:Protein TIFY n=4 Tax=Gossypium TaxID=3633 RepID=A0A5J5UC49_GOSBA|nr:hypothetical protein ES319_A09G081000v1 [Gossypium barbadense]TYH01931.1 hypothetical protein ES288_A09G099400v1 [Gossypium darwinii]TYI09752.1 hypothetical protein ES332_A09G094900v1 [Gossypium tomentosum]TYJ17885.1 hypothetical protein E1A91_A09G084600v1 [Gossypium mustelinum]